MISYFCTTKPRGAGVMVWFLHFIFRLAQVSQSNVFSFFNYDFLAYQICSFHYNLQLEKDIHLNYYYYTRLIKPVIKVLVCYIVHTVLQ